MSTPNPPELYPALIGVFCDDCGTTVKRDYMVSDDDGPKARFEYARAALRREGWKCDQTGDQCGPCTRGDTPKRRAEQDGGIPNDAIASDDPIQRGI